MSKPANLRAEMPHVTAFIDDLRAVFGADDINAQIRKGMGGLPGYFHATENGHEVGTPDTRRYKEVSGAQMRIEQPAKENHADRNRRR